MRKKLSANKLALIDLIKNGEVIGFQVDFTQESFLLPDDYRDTLGLTTPRHENRKVSTTTIVIRSVDCE